jgi:hypothetical protein
VTRPDISTQLFFHATPITQCEQLRPFLGKPEHLREGKSAYELCHAWLDANGIPDRVRAVLDTDAYYHGAELVEGLFEHQVDLGTRGRPSQTDLLALVRLRCCDHAVVAVEGKAGEPFGPLLPPKTQADEGRWARLIDLARQLGFEGEPDPRLRYQLFHRTVSALREARRYQVCEAMLLIHAFTPDEKSVEAFKAFASAIRVVGADVDAVSSVREFDGIRLRLAWVQDEPSAGWQDEQLPSP